MENYKNVLFDLDGTLTDSAEGIINSVEYALGQYGIAVPDRSALYRFIGPPLYDAFISFYGFSPEQAAEAIVHYRERYSRLGLFENAVYPGVEEMLRQLSDAGLRLFVATSKPEPYAVRILGHFALNGYFTGIVGEKLGGCLTNNNNTATTGGRLSSKAAVVQEALVRHSLDPRETVMVGDRKFDVLGAAENGLSTIGVLYGYGSPEELTAAGAAALADDPAALTRMLLDGGQ